MSALTRRHFIAGSTLLFSAPIASPLAARPTSDRLMWDIWDEDVRPPGYIPFTSNPWGIEERFLPQRVFANDGLTPGDIHVDAVARYLYHVEENGTAMRYGVAIARGDLYEPGTYTMQRRAKWPIWTPTANMIAREPEVYEQFAGGMDGGPENPLGSRAIYLFVGNRDTYLRIHGTPFQRSIGGRASSGCVRMVQQHAIDLYENVETGKTAFLYPPEDAIGEA